MNDTAQLMNQSVSADVNSTMQEAAPSRVSHCIDHNLGYTTQHWARHDKLLGILDREQQLNIHA